MQIKITIILVFTITIAKLKMTENIIGEFVKQLTLSNMVVVNWNWFNHIVKIFPLPT